MSQWNLGSDIHIHRGESQRVLSRTVELNKFRKMSLNPRQKEQKCSHYPPFPVWFGCRSEMAQRRATSCTAISHTSSSSALVLPVRPTCFHSTALSPRPPLQKIAQLPSREQLDWFTPERRNERYSLIQLHVYNDGGGGRGAGDCQMVLKVDGPRPAANWRWN